MSTMKPNDLKDDEHSPNEAYERSRPAHPLQPTGWAAMAEKMRIYDEEKIKDVKEDIDRLLVFVRLLHVLL
jgi:hypothetical protein